MMPRLVTASPGELVSLVAPFADRERARGFIAIAVALLVHTCIAGFAPHERRHLLAEPTTTLVELMPPDREPSIPAPREPTPRDEQKVEPPTERLEPSTRARVATPLAARAGAIVTAKAEQPNEQKSAEPLDFTHDASVTGYGGGVVAVGGTASFGAANAVAKPVLDGSTRRGVDPHGSGLVPLSNLGRKPALGESDPCRGFFPSGAHFDSGEASVRVILTQTGKVTSASVIRETPSAQGFGSAARACMLSKTFVPALDRSGNAVATSLLVNVRFTR